ncbi:MAG TPA: ABC transporter permease [Vicinamibacterales bacterium]|nr:ABC transporter permease [Vicinamibacterales bacterium]
MSILRTVLARVRALRRARHADRDLDEELRAYVDARAASYERQGRAPADARRAALIEVEGIEQVKERVRDVRIGSTVEAAARDARYGARVLWRSPGYALIVIVTIALGIGVNAAIFSVVHAVLWRSLPYPDAARILVIEADTRALPSAYSSSGPVFDVRTQSRLITSIAQVEGRDASLEVDGVMERVAAARATDELLPLLGATPLTLGRTLVTAEDAHDIVVRGVVISHELWQRRLEGDPQVIGRRLTVNNFDVQVVGVMRPDFRLVLPARNHAEERIDVWLPRDFAPSLLYRGLPLVGRLAPGASVAGAQAELTALASGFVAGHPSAYPGGLRLTVRPLGEVVTRDVKPALVALSAAVGFVLIIACVNVANLHLARTRTRERELAVRRALGATRLRLVRQLLAENLILAVLGGACGLLLARLGVGALDWLRPVHLPRQSEIAIDGAAMLWTAGLTVVSSVLFGLVPALAFTRDADGQPLHSSRAGSLQLRSRRLHRGLVLSEIALSIVPLIAAGLMLRTFANLVLTPIGFDPAHVVTARISLNLGEFSTVDRRSAFYRDAIARVGGLPGVEAASIGGPPPLAPVQSTLRFWGSDDGEGTMGMHRSVMPGYLGVMGIPLRAGRDISDDDIRHRRRVVVVDERLAARLWHGEAVGKRLSVEYSKQPLEVVGVAGHIRARDIRDSGTLMIYVPSHVYEIEQTLVVKTRAPLSTIGPAIKQAVEALGPGRPVFDIRPMDDIVEASIDTTRFTMLLLSGFGMTSLVLAGVGLYGTLAYLTSQRTQEFGVRLALGASAGSILRLVVREGGLLTGLGAALGLAGAMAVTRALQGLLYGVTPVDALTIASVVGLVAAVALVAVGWPAWRAACVDPTTALRAE